MHAPCANCPFLKKGGVRLTMARVEEIAGGVLMSQGRTFQCHKTLRKKEQHCGGALIFAEKNGNATQMMRIAERLGLYKPDQLKGRELVFDTMADMMKTAVDYQEGTGEPCHVVDADCTAPAGYQTSSGVAESAATAQYECHECCEPVCGECSGTTTVKRGRKKEVVRICNYCLEEERGED